jgi:hypothetical protein
MNTVELVLEFVKVILSAPVIGGAVGLTALLMFRKDIQSLLLRAGRIRFPGGEFEASQLDKSRESDGGKPEPVPEEPGSIDAGQLPQSLTPEQSEAVRQLFLSERARAALWEYRFLNYFLVRGTQIVLDWFAALSSPLSYELFHTYWTPVIMSVREREAILQALAGHYLIADDNGLLSITPKGREYLQWRGPLPALPHVSPAVPPANLRGIASRIAGGAPLRSGEDPGAGKGS